MSEPRDSAYCRGCRRMLRGEDYRYGGRAFLLEGGEAKKNHYGGFVCSMQCDFNASLALERSMPGHGLSQRVLGGYAQNALNRNWPHDQ